MSGWLGMGGEGREDGGPYGFPVLAKADVHGGRLGVGVHGRGEFEGDGQPIFDGAEQARAGEDLSLIHI